MTANAALERDRVGPYQILRAIGAGGSARIDLACIERAYGFQRHVVIKRPLEHLRGDARAAASLQREARLGGQLRHPNLVSILDAGVHAGYDYLVLEYVHGGSLRELMQAESGAKVRDVPLDVALAIVADVARGLHDAHELVDEHGAPLGLVHRDVSPGNVLIGLDGAVKLADFGIAKETRVATLSGSMHGTVTYMAPEQCRGHAFDRRADVFSLGVILYELVTGTRLFWADNDVASLHRVLSGNVPRPRKVRPTITAALEDIVMMAVAPEPERRWGTARALADAIEAHAAQAGEILGARQIARWVHDLIGPRDAPWVGDETIVERISVPTKRAAEDAGSLVELIAATPEDAPPLPTFGPSDGLAPADAAIDPAFHRGHPRAPTARYNRRLAAIIGIAIVAGVAAGAFVIARPDRKPADAGFTTPQPVTPPLPSRVESPDPTPEPAAITSPEPTAEPTAEPTTEPMTKPTTEPAARPSKVPPPVRSAGDRRRRPPSKSTKAAKRVPAGSAVPVETAPPPAGSGSQVTRPARTRVEWNPTMLLPTDSGSGSGSGTKKP